MDQTTDIPDAGTLENLTDMPWELATIMDDFAAANHRRRKASGERERRQRLPRTLPWFSLSHHQWGPKKTRRKTK